MGYKIAIALLFLVLPNFATAADADGDSAFKPEIVNIPLNKVYVPVGFDDNDRVQIVVEGDFPNTCYKIGPYTFHMNEVTKTLSVQQTAYKYMGVCIQMQVPFTQVVDLGLMRSGDWTLEDSTAAKTLGRLPIQLAAGPGPDDFLYAPVTEAYVHKDSETLKNALSFMGTFTDRCTRLKEVRVHYYTDVIVVQPIAEQIGPLHNCGHELTRFAHTVLLKEDLKGTYLLHVRSMNGQAINKLVEMPE